MIQVIYTSVAAEPFSTAALRQLLTASRLRNQAADLTGVLIYRNGTFVQLLEGTSGSLDATLTRIRRDPRHRDLRVIREGSAPQRLFPEWRMRFADGSGGSQLRRGFEDLASGLPFEQMSDDGIVRLVLNMSPHRAAVLSAAV